jgi:hypothetical protein
MDPFTNCPITLDPDEILEYTRQAISVLTECWDMDYDDSCEPREEIKQAGVLLDLYWASQQGSKTDEAR